MTSTVSRRFVLLTIFPEKKVLFTALCCPLP